MFRALCETACPERSRRAGFPGSILLALKGSRSSRAETHQFGIVQRPLLSERPVPVIPSALKESVTHHAVAEQKKEDRQQDYKQEVSTSEGWWLRFFRVRRIQ